jgi:hypothetical protein
MKKHTNAYPVSNPARQNTMCPNGDCYWDQCECAEHDHSFVCRRCGGDYYATENQRWCGECAEKLQG